MPGGGHDAAVLGIADHVLELDGGVVDVELFPQLRLYPAKNGLAFRRRDIGDSDMAGERVAVAADGPDMQVVDIVHSRNAGDFPGQSFQVKPLGRALQQNVQRLAENSRWKTRG